MNPTEVRGWLELFTDYPEMAAMGICFILVGFTVHSGKVMLKLVWRVDPNARRFAIMLLSLVGGWFISQYILRHLGFEQAELMAFAVAVSNAKVYDILVKVAVARKWMTLYAILKGRSLYATEDGGIKVVKVDESTGREVTEFYK